MDNNDARDEVDIYELIMEGEDDPDFIIQFFPPPPPGKVN